LGIGWGRETRALAYDEERRPPAAGGAAVGGATAVVDGRVRHAVGAGEQRVRAGRHRRRRRGGRGFNLCGRRSAKSNGRRISGGLALGAEKRQAAGAWTAWRSAAAAAAGGGFAFAK